MPLDNRYRDLERVISPNALLFVLLAETQSFSDVAQIAGQTQSSVSKRIARLENELGVALIDRTRRPVLTTQEGKLFYSELKRQCESLGATLSLLKSRSALKPVVRLGCVESLSADLIPEVLLKLLPVTSKLSQIIGTSNTLLRLLLEHQLDIIISSDAFASVSGLHRRFLFREPSVLLMSKAMASRKSGRWTWDELLLCGKPFIHYNLESGGGRLNETYLSTRYLSPPNKLEVDTNTVMVSLIGADAGWTIARPSTLLQTKDLAAGVAAVPMPEPMLTREVHLISRANEEKAIVDVCFQSAREVLHESVIPALKKTAPWAEAYIQEAP